MASDACNLEEADWWSPQVLGRFSVYVLGRAMSPVQPLERLAATISMVV